MGVVGDTSVATYDERAEITFFKWNELYLKEKPFQYIMEVPEAIEDKRSTNILHERKAVSITDIRGSGSQWSLDDHGFAFVDLPLDFTDFSSEQAVDDEYIPQVRHFLLEKLDGADEVVIFDWRMRSSHYTPKAIDMSFKNTLLPPSMEAHVDQSPSRVVEMLRGPSLLKYLTREQITEFIHGRVRIVNLWRPINGTVEDYPFTLCDGSTVDPTDLVVHDAVRSNGDRIRETVALSYNEGQRWYYCSQQRTDEAWLVKCFDSRNDVRASCSPHTSFRPSKVADNARPRESIEIRAFVFTSPQSS
ncbi:hypothetical protein SAMD00023353_9700030 [Rosellinia necatrix]|uniref:Uncharacterized protein n=1 Tax=Rosellinia necatrix TaxID=77044 RepID=A0A1W2TW57_ROSNE|nr:hypothetical protein SAMD00023353_9700030 [Rosellinia necatrix]